MTNISAYQAILRSLPEWEPYLRAESNLPGSRANLALAYAAAEVAPPEQIEALLAYGPDTAPENTPGVFLVVCGTIALGRLLAEGKLEVLPRLRQKANDPRWRVREGAAMALQRWGDADMTGLIAEMRSWANGTLLEQRAMAAGLCEPRLLVKAEYASATLALLNQVTRGMINHPDRRSEAFQALRKGLGYCWSVAIAALPEEGKKYFEPWAAASDPDIRWIVRENLKKNRLTKMDAVWVKHIEKIIDVNP